MTKIIIQKIFYLYYNLDLKIKDISKELQVSESFVKNNKSSVLEPLPFNSGYFMSFNVKSGNAEDIRKKLLKEKGIGIIQIDANTLRVAFSSIDEEKIEEVYKSIYEVAESM